MNILLVKKEFEKKAITISTNNITLSLFTEVDCFTDKYKMHEELYPIYTWRRNVTTFKGYHLQSKSLLTCPEIEGGFSAEGVGISIPMWRNWLTYHKPKILNVIGNGCQFEACALSKLSRDLNITHYNTIYEQYKKEIGQYIVDVINTWGIDNNKEYPIETMLISEKMFTPQGLAILKETLNYFNPIKVEDYTPRKMYLHWVEQDIPAIHDFCTRTGIMMHLRHREFPEKDATWWVDGWEYNNIPNSLTYNIEVRGRITHV